MAITFQTVGKYRYINYSKSFRNDDGVPRNIKVRFGKIDLATGKKLYDADW